MPHLRSLVTVALMASVGTGVAQKNSLPDGIHSSIIATYERLGATYGGWVQREDEVVFVVGSLSAKKGHPGFSFPRVPSGKLPDAGIPFGLHFAACEGIDDNLLKQLTDLNNLTVLDLSRTDVTDAGLKTIASLKNLTTLDLAWTRVSEGGLKELAPLKKLTTLNLTRGTYRYRQAPGGNITDKSLGVLRSVGLLHAIHAATAKDGGRPTSPDDVASLSLHLTEVTDVGLKELTSLKNLSVLSLEGTEITNQGIKELVGFQRLTQLNLNDTKLTDRGIKAIGTLKHLTALSLGGTELTDVGLADLSDLKDNLTILHLNHTNVTDKGLRHLQTFKKLTALRLDGTQITDAGLKDLAGLTQLTSLCLGSSKVTKSGAMELRKSLPNCKIND